MKKIFSISLGIFLLTLLFLGVYNFAFKSNPKSGVVDRERQEQKKAEEEASFASGTEQKYLEKVTDRPAFGAMAISEDRIAYFNGGKFYSASLGGGGEEVLIDALPGKLIRSEWSKERRQALGLFLTPTGNQWHLIKPEDRSITPLKKEILNMAWSEIGDRVFYTYKTGKGTSLNTAKPDGSDWKELGMSPVTDPYIKAVPNSILLSFWTRPNGLEETSLYTMPLTGGAPGRIFSGKFGGNYSWAPDGNRLLISSSPAKGSSDMRLGIANQNGGEYRILQVPTIVPKTAWSGDGKTLYYSLPTGIPTGAVLPNDYFSRPILTKDSFWKMDIESGRNERIIDIADIPGDFDAIDLFLDPRERFLFFTNRGDGNLYRISIVK